MRTNRKRIRNVGGKDRLSNLHDSILIHILSFLDDTKSAAQTCVLSKRWNENFWIQLPYLNLNSTTFGKNSDEFEKFVETVLAQRDNFNFKLHTFCFCWSFESQIPQALLDRVHSFAQSHDVQHFDLSIGCRAGYHSYPSQNFSPKSLTVLKLNLSNWYQLTLTHEHNPYLQNQYLSGCTALKTLWLEKICIEIRSIPELDLFSNLVNLTELRLIGCRIVGRDGRFHVRAPRLERLIILDNVDHLGREIINAGATWMISSPMLKYLRIDLWGAILFPCYLPYIEELEINFHSHIPNKSLLPSFILKKVIDMLQCALHAKTVTLSMTTLQALSAFPHVLKSEAPSPQFQWKCLKVIKTKQLPTKEFPNYLRALTYLRKRCSEALELKLIV